MKKGFHVNNTFLTTNKKGSSQKFLGWPFLNKATIVAFCSSIDITRVMFDIFQFTIAIFPLKRNSISNLVFWNSPSLNL